MHSLKRSSLRGETKLLFVLLIAFLLLGGLFFSLLYKDFQRVKTFYVKKEEFQKEIQSLKKEEKEKHSFFKKIIENWKKDIETLKKLLSQTEVKKEGKSFLYKGEASFYNLDVLSSAVFGSSPSDTFLVLAQSSFKGNISLEGDLLFEKDGTLFGKGKIEIRPKDELYLKDSLFLDKKGNLIQKKGFIKTGKLTFDGNIFLEPQADKKTKVIIQNPKEGKEADLEVEGEISIKKGKITLKDGKEIFVDENNNLKISSNKETLFLIDGEELLKITKDETQIQKDTQIKGKLEVEKDTLVQGNLEIKGDISVEGAQVFSGVQGIVANSSSPALSIIQKGEGKIVEFKNKDKIVFEILNDGEIKVAGDILPKEDLSFSLGSPSLRWKNLYLQNAYLSGTLETTSFRMPTGAQSGYVLTSDAQGFGTWQSLPETLPPGSLGQTLRHDGTGWVADSFLSNLGDAIGIGTTTPAYSLDIVGDVRWSGKLQGGEVPWQRLSGYPSIIAGSGLTGGGTLSSSLTLSHADTSSQSSIDNSQGVVIQDITLDEFGHITSLGTIDLDPRFVNTSGDTITGSLNINETLTVSGTTTLATSSGKVGIGTSTPEYTLDVNGNIRAMKSLTAGINVETLSSDKTLTPGVDEMYQWLSTGGTDRIV